jgi:hypothetical protein
MRGVALPFRLTMGSVQKAKSTSGNESSKKHTIKISRRKLSAEIRCEYDSLRRITKTDTHDNIVNKRGSIDPSYCCVLIFGHRRYYDDTEKGTGEPTQAQREWIRKRKQGDAKDAAPSI